MAESLPFQITPPTPPKHSATSDCKYSYSTWCPTCERDSPRRQQRQHMQAATQPSTADQPTPCRRRQRDMKSTTHNHQHGYQGVEVLSENDYNHVHRADESYGCCVGSRNGCRVNLCELPTTYISGQDNVVCRQTGTTTCGNTSTAESPSQMTAPHQIKTGLLSSSSSKAKSSASSRKCAEQLNHNNIDIDSVFYDTCTYMDRATYNAELTANLRDRYQQEIETLRNKLKELKSGRHRNHLSLTVKNLDRLPTDTSDADIRIIENVEEYKRSLKAAITGGRADVKEFLSAAKRGDGAGTAVVRSSASRLSVKTRSKLSAVKMRKRKTKEGGSSKMAVMGSKGAGGGGMYGGSVSSSDFTESECSESEAEYAKEEDILLADESDEKPSTNTMNTTVDSGKGAGEGAGDQGVNWPLRESLFAHVPPYISFNSYDALCPYDLPIGRKYLKWKLSTITPVVVRRTVINTGFSLVRSEFSRESNDWCGTWGKHMKSPMFKTLKTTQKLNHFAGTFQIGRKDRLWRNMQRLAMKHGTKEFGFLPQTFVLPQDLKLLKHSWMYKNGSGGEKWIIKPPASARGVGIKVINRWSQLPKRISLIVQRYISDPYLINGSKFDLRLYVLVTSFNPLRIYLYPDGLARFASAKYSSDDRDLRDRYMHLTNYSINKLSSQYTANEDANACQGHKWTLTKLWDYLSSKGVNTRQIQVNLNALVIKTILSGESPIVQLCAENVTTRYNCYELFGVDVLLDADLRPWLLEVNISPSLHSSSPLDAHVKGPLVKALMNLVQFHLPPRVKKIPGSPPVLDPRLYTNVLSKRDRVKHDRIGQLESREEYLNEILDNLTSDDVRVLTQAEDELVVRGPFERIFPTARTYKYLEFIESRYYNRLFDAWECMFEKNRNPGIKMLQSLCVQKIHLKFPKESNAAKKSQSTINTLLANLVQKPHICANEHKRDRAKTAANEPTDETTDEESPHQSTQSIIIQQRTTKVNKVSPTKNMAVDATAAVAIVA